MSVRVTLEEISMWLSKEDRPHQWGWASSNLLSAWIEQKVEEGRIWSLCLGWDIHLLLLSKDTGTPGSWAFGLRPGLTPSASCSQAFGLGLNYSTGSQACRHHIVGLLTSRTTWNNSYNKSPLTFIYIYLSLTDSVSLENPDKYTILI